MSVMYPALTADQTSMGLASVLPADNQQSIEPSHEHLANGNQTSVPDIQSFLDWTSVSRADTDQEFETVHLIHDHAAIVNEAADQECEIVDIIPDHAAVVNEATSSRNPSTGGVLASMDCTSDVPADTYRSSTDLPRSSGHCVPEKTQAGVALYQLMEVKSDKQDLSFVEKVIFPREQILSFSNALVSRSARAPNAEYTFFDFEMLNQRAVCVTGFYGHKALISESFEMRGIIEAADPILAQMKQDRLKAGLYAFLQKDSLYIFYWHTGSVLPQASRKEISCNFIRCLVDMCDTVCVLLEAEEVKRFPSAGKTSRIARGQRNRKMNIVKQKATENSIQVSPGFILTNINLDSREGFVERALKVPKIFQLSEGGRCALITSRVRAQEVSKRSMQRTFKMEEFPNFVKDWKNYDVDFSKIPDVDFSLFLQTSGLAAGKGLIALLQTLELKNSVRQADLNSVWENRANVEWLRWSQIIEQFLTRYVKLKYGSWEEALSTDELDRCTDEIQATDFTLHRSEPILHVDQSSSSGHWPTAWLARGASMVMSFISNKNDRGANFDQESRGMPNQDLDDPILNQLEQDLWKGSVQRLIFPGSELRIQCRAKAARPAAKSLEKITFVVQRDSGERARKSPVMRGERLILLPKNNNLKMKWEVSFESSSERDALLVTGEEVQIGFTRGTTLSDGDRIVLNHQSSIGCLQSWIGPITHDFIQPLSARAALLSFVVEKVQKLSGVDQLWDHEILRDFFTAQNPLDMSYSILESYNLKDEVQKKWLEVQTLSFKRQTETCASLWRSLPPKIVAVCKDEYEKRKDDLNHRVQVEVKRLSARVRQMGLQNERLRASQLLKEEIRAEKSNFLRDTRTQLLHAKQEGSKIFVTSCRLYNGNAGQILEGPEGLLSVPKCISRSRYNSADVSVAVKFEVEEMGGQQSICFDAFEVAPMKNDLGKLLTDPGHPFTPACSQRHTFLDVDPNVEKLLKVVFLKSGRLLVFLLASDELNIYLLPKLGVKLADRHLIRTMKRGLDLVAFDEQSKFLGLYQSSLSVIKTYRFDDSFRNLDWTGADANLSEFGNTKIIWMDFVPERKELVFVDGRNKVRVFEMVSPYLIKPKEIDLGPAPFVKACVASQGPCLLVFRGSIHCPQAERSDEGAHHQIGTPSCSGIIENTDPGDKTVEASRIEEDHLCVEVYWIDDTMAHVMTLPLNDIGTSDVSKIQATIMQFETQTQLVLHNRDRPNTLVSRVLKITSDSEVYSLSKVVKPSTLAEERSTESISKEGPHSSLDYIYHIFDKYSTDPPLVTERRDLCIRMLVKGSTEPVGDECLKYFKSCLQRLEAEKGKTFKVLRITGEFSPFDSDFVHGDAAATTCVPMGDWIQRLLCLIPIQIARAENNGLKPLVDGLQLRDDVDYADAVSLANVIRFGFYDAVLANWKGSVKVISSMGKQSSGKSYLLNHLSGSLLDVSGGRCTDGVWMTLRIVDECLYVLLDFEGLGSFERSEQEDMLLSVLNAAVSNITIFNKKDFHLDKETEAVFERFQNGVTLVRADDKLFQGTFYMAIKDVDNSDVEDLQEEFERKIKQMLAKTGDNFLTKMYGGSVEIATMASFNRPEYYESIEDIAVAVEELQSSYKNGRSFSVDLKLVISQLCAKDWSPIDFKRVALKINLIRKHLSSAITLGCLSQENSGNGESHLIQFDTQKRVADEPIQLDSTYHRHEFSLQDTCLELASEENGTSSISEILTKLKQMFQCSIERTGTDDEEWHTSLRLFITALADRRRERVLEWVVLNTEGLQESDGDVQKLNLEIKASLAELKQDLSLCNSKCDRCFLKCTKEKGHSPQHSCLGVGLGEHTCKERCTYCVDCEGAHTSSICADLAGHQGSHDCKLKPHTCTQACIYADESWNCNKKCSYLVGHSEDHKCNSKEHLCKQTCSLPECNNPCVSPFVTDHERHACHEKVCPKICPLEGCNRNCASQDHFHALDPTASHLCGNQHRCYKECESRGICEVHSELIKIQKVFTGKRGTFDYDHVTEQNGKRKECSIVLAPFEDKHAGPHTHTTTPNAVHFCSTKCPACGYFCNLPIGHEGLHNTTHGNMRHAIFASETEEIDCGGRRYAWGEHGVAEMCNMHCKAQGRGHTHLHLCPGKTVGGACLSLTLDGTRHETQRYGPDFNTPKDEMTHAAYWKHIRFVDPCSIGEQEEFGLCNYQCMSEDHKCSDSNKCHESKQRKVSYCTEKLWHDQLSRSDEGNFPTGYITRDGHHMSCVHAASGEFEAIHIIFIVDISYSMETRDIVPQLQKFKSNHNNRLGCVFEAIMQFIRTRLDHLKHVQEKDDVSVIRFEDYGHVSIRQRIMDERIVDELLVQSRDMESMSRGTDYCAGLGAAQPVVQNSTLLRGKTPVVIFLSDGADGGSGDPKLGIRALKSLHSDLIVHTVVFGKEGNTALLEEMAEVGGGQFHVSIDHLQLIRTFVSLAKKPAVAALVNDRRL